MNLSDKSLNNLTINFIDELIKLYDNKEYLTIKNVLIGEIENKKTYKYTQNDRTVYLDDDDEISIRIWVDKESKDLLNVLHFICNKDSYLYSNTTTKMINMWIYLMNSDMSLFFNDNVKCSGKKQYATIRISEILWNKFLLRCKRLNITVHDGFKSCIKEYIENRTEIMKMLKEY